MASDAGRVIPLPKGSWNALTTYETLDIVSYGNQTWMAKLSSIGIAPTEGQYWTVYGSAVGMATTSAMGIVKMPTDGTITIDADGTIHGAGGSADLITTTDPDKSVQDVLDDLDADKADDSVVYKKANDVFLTMAEYEALPSTKLTDGKHYYITDGDGEIIEAVNVPYDNATSALSATNAQGAIDELANPKNVLGDEDAYSSVKVYSVGDMCIYQRKLYKCLVSCTGIVPTNTSYWAFVSLSNMMEKFDYSTEEKVVGTWIDGKKLYRKTYSGRISNSSTINYISIDDLDYDSAWIDNDSSFFCYDIGSGDYYREGGILNFYVSQTDWSRVLVQPASKKIKIVKGSTSTYSGSLVYITILYTKTTD